MNQRDIDVSALYGFEAGLRECAGELERARDTAVALEGRVAALKDELDMVGRNWRKCLDQRDEEWQRREKAEGRVAELERQIAEHVCRIPVTHSVRPPLVIDDDE